MPTTEELRILIEAEWLGKRDAAAARADIKGLGVDAKQAAPGLEQAAKSAGTFDNTLKKLVAGGVLLEAGRRVLQFGQDSLDAFSTAEEAWAKASVVFGDSLGDTTAELEDFGERVGRSTNSLIGFASGFQDTLVPLGFARDVAAGLSVDLTKLTTDLASFNNVTSAQTCRQTTW